jgi:LPXTG-motif cell wall-anchored protein
MNTTTIVGLALGLSVLLAVAFWLWRRRRRRSTVETALAAIAHERLRDVFIPDGMGGEIHIEHLLLTVRGILVVNVKPYVGVVFASDRMDQWTAIGPKGRSVFPNPLSNLYDRIAAVRQLVRDIEVEGFVVFPSLADFSKGRPADVRLPEDLLADYSRSNDADPARVTGAFAPHWERIVSAAKPA